MKWDKVCRPTGDPFSAFLSPGAQRLVYPQTILIYLKQLKKFIYWACIHPKKIIIPASFHSKAFLLLYKFETSWALLGRLSRGSFFCHLRGKHFKHFKQHFMTSLDLALKLCKSFLVESPILYLAFFKTILGAFFRTFGLLLRFLSSKPSFLHDHFTTQHSDFSSFLGVSITDKSLNRSILAYALT